MRAALALTALLALGACNKDKATTVTTSDGKEVKITADGNNSSDSGTITFEGKDGEGKITFGDAASKQGLPLGMPVYPGGEVKGAFMGSGDGSKGGMVTVMSKDAPTKVSEFYKAEAKKHGFEINSQTITTTDQGEMANFSAKNANGDSLMVNASPDQNGGTVVAIMGGGKG